ncbi:hypothetical protein ACFX15_000973 [Malus domestica]
MKTGSFGLGLEMGITKLRVDIGGPLRNLRMVYLLLPTLPTRLRQEWFSAVKPIDSTPISQNHKINVNGAWMTPFQAKVAIVFRDSQGIELAREHHMEHAIIESDPKAVFEILSKRTRKGSWRICPIVDVKLANSRVSS